MARTTVDDSLSLDINGLIRGGWLVPGKSGQTTWRRGETVTSTINWRVEPGALWLHYNTKHYGGGTTESHYPVRLLQAPSGRGWRTWFGCPRCGRLCGRLHSAAGVDEFWCRLCLGLAYDSQQSRTSLGIASYRRRERLEDELYRAKQGSKRWWRLICESRGASERTQRVFERLLDHSDRALRRLGVDAPPRGQETTELVEGEQQRWPRGRPKEKRPYTRRQPVVIATEPATDRAYCVKCKDRRRLIWRRRSRLKNGRWAIRGRCAECATRLVRIIADTARAAV